jgi:hypothetical protein
VSHTNVLSRGVAKLVKALDFDSSMRGFESFLPCHPFALVQLSGKGLRHTLQTIALCFL